MRAFGKSEDKAFDRLVRAELTRHDAAAHCGGFDPDLASAYLEGALKGAEITRYEGHLAGCSGCRAAIRHLASPLPASREGVIKPSFSGSGLGLISALLQPKWALLAAAGVAIAVAVPMLLNSSRHARQGLPEATQVAVHKTPEASGPAATSELETVQSAERGRSSNSRGNLSDRAAGDVVGSYAGPAQETPVAASAVVPSVEPSKESESHEQKKEAEANVARAQGQTASDAPRPAEVAQFRRDEGKLDRIDQKKALTLTGEESKTAETQVLRPGMTTDQPRSQREKAGAIRPGDDVARAPALPEAVAGRRAVTRNEREGAETAAESDKDAARLRSSDALSKAKPTAQRKVAKKTFTLLDGIWTDKDYRPDKDLPSVTLVRGSDVFTEQLSRHRELKIYLDAFAATDRVIVVYKDTVYKFVPPEKQDG